jgi:DNA mismatch repair ATPase MutS
MGGFVELHNLKPTYHAFCEDIQKQKNVLNRLETELATITPFTFSFSKLNQTGYMLKCYYQLYSNEEYGEALRFSFGFEGYINNMLGVFDNWKKGNVSPASFKNSKTKGNAGVPSSSNQLYIKEQYYPSHDKELAVKNSIKMGVQKTQKSKTKGMVITGPNASGKTTLLKTTAINIILTQQLGMGYYTKCTLPPFKYIHSYLNIPDTSGRDSLFQAESRRCKDILDSIHTGDKEDRHFCIFDELYSGTNPVEASKASFAFLKYLSGFENVVFVLTTHYTCVCKKIIKNGISSIVNRKMAVERNPADENELIYTYKLEKGISSVEGAITILKSLNYPDEIMRDFV